MHSPCLVSANNRPPVWSGSTTGHATLSDEGGNLFSILQVPHPQRLVKRRRDGTAPVENYRYSVDPARVAFELAQRLAALQVPHSQRLVIRRRDGTATVGRYRHSADATPMAFEAAYHSAALPVPHPQRLGIRRPDGRPPG